MTDRNNRSDEAVGLRQRAETTALKISSDFSENLDARGPDETRRILHDLRVHQIELEMQNEELRRTQQELEASRARYFDLYDLAPVGYVTLSQQGAILEANLTASTMLGAPRGALVNRQLTAFILPADQDIYYRHRKRLFETGEPQLCELGMVRPDGNQFWALLDAIVAQDGATRAPLCRVTMSDITERKKAEDALRESETKLRIVADNTYDWEFWMSPESRFVYISPSCKRITGHDAAEFLADPQLMSRLVHPDDRPKFIEHQKNIMEQKRSVDMEFRIVTPDGANRWIHEVCQPVFDDNQVFIGMRGSNRDITERKRAEEALRESERKFRAIFDNANDGFISVDLESRRFFNANRRMMEMLGYESEEEIRKLTVSDIHPEKDLPHVLEEFKKHASGEISRTDELPVKRKNGSVLFTSVSSSPMTIGEKTYLSCIFRDVTERKKAEDALRESEKRYRVLFDAAPITISMATLEGKALAVNHAIEEMAGYTTEEVLTLNLNGFYVNPDDRKRAIAHLQEQGKVRDFETAFRGKDGRTVDVLLSMDIIELGGQKVTLSTIRDITGRKKAEERIRQQLLELQRWHNVTLDREGRVSDLKQEVNELLRRLGEPGRYSSSGCGETETPLTEWGGKETREERQRP